MDKSKMKKLECWIVGDSELLSVGKDNIILKKIDTDRFSFTMFDNNGRMFTKDYNLAELKKIFVEV
jgi:hypothetical protein